MSSFESLANPRISGLATYEPGRPIETVARELGFSDASQIVKVASNENALGPSPRAVEAMQRAAVEMHLYPDGGCFQLREALAQKLDMDPSCILPGNGSNEVLELLGRVFLNERSGIVMADRAFVVYRLIAEACGAGVVEVPMHNHCHDLDAMLAAIRPETRIVFISNPNNPTSTIVSPEHIDRFMDKVPGHVLTCFDEAYVELLAPELRPDTLRYVREGRNVVIMRTFSKAYGLAGLRVGYAVAPAECIALLHRVRQPFNVNAMGQLAAVAALEDDAHVEQTRQCVREGLAFFDAAFREMGLSAVPAHANFVLVDVGNGRAVFEAMMKKGVIVRPMSVYRMDRHVRITIGTAAENIRTLTVLQEVLKETGTAA